MPASPTNYLGFLSVLIALGTKLPTIWPLVQAWIVATTNLVTAVKGVITIPAPAEPLPGTLSLYQPTAEELELEGQVAALIIPAGSQAAFDGSRLRALFAFVQAHPELVTWLLTFLRG